MHCVWRGPCVPRLLRRLAPPQSHFPLHLQNHHIHRWNKGLLAALASRWLATMQALPHRKVEAESEKDDIARNVGNGSKSDKHAAPPSSRQKQSVMLNAAITAKIIRLVMDEGHKIVSREEALKYASEKGLDLVMVDAKADPAVCKVFDYHKHTFKKQQSAKDRKKNQIDRVRLNVLKEIRFSSKTEESGLELKATRVRELLERGHRVKLVVNYDPTEVQPELLDRLLPMVGDTAVVEQGPRTESRLAWVICRHIRFGPVRKKPQAQKVVPKVQVEQQAQEVTNREEEYESDQCGVNEESDFENEEEEEQDLSDSEPSNTRLQMRNRATSQDFPQTSKKPQRDMRQKYEEPGNMRQNYEKPGNMRQVYEEPGNMRQNYEMPGNMRQVYEEPGNRRQNYGKPGNMRQKYEEPGNMRQNYEMPGNMRQKYEEPGSMRQNYEMPGNMRQKYEEPGSRRQKHEKPGNMRPKYEEPGNMRQNYQMPGNMRQKYEEPGSMRQKHEKPGNMRQKYEEPGNVRQNYQMPGNMRQNYENSGDRRQKHQNLGRMRERSEQPSSSPMPRQSSCFGQDDSRVRQTNSQNTAVRIQQQIPYKQQDFHMNFPQHGFHEPLSANASMEAHDRVPRSRGPDNRFQTDIHSSQSSPQATNGTYIPFYPESKPRTIHVIPPISFKDTTHPVDPASPVSSFRPIQHPSTAQTINMHPNPQTIYTPFSPSYSFQSGHHPNTGSQGQSTQPRSQNSAHFSLQDDKPVSFRPHEIQHPGHTPQVFKDVSPQDLSGISSDNESPHIPVFTPSKRPWNSNPQTTLESQPQNPPLDGQLPDTSDTTEKTLRQDQVRKPFRPFKRP